VVSNCRTCNILHLPWHSSHLALYVGIWMFLKLGWWFENVGLIVRKPRYISFRTLFDDILIEDILTVTLRSNMLFPFTSLLSQGALLTVATTVYNIRRTSCGTQKNRRWGLGKRC
jgi:hypothetical protein